MQLEDGVNMKITFWRALSIVELPINLLSIKFLNLSSMFMTLSLKSLNMECFWVIHLSFR